MTISSGLFTSAFVVLLVSIKEYWYERKKALEKLYFAAYDILHTFMGIYPFITDEPIKIVAECLGEIDNNKFNEETNKQLKERIPDIESESLIPYDNFAKKKYKMYLLSNMATNEILKYRTLNQLDEYLEKQYDYNMNRYIMYLEKSIDSYLRFDSIDCKEMTIAINEIDFLFANKTIRKRVFDDLYLYVFQMVFRVKNHMNDFKSYTTGRTDCKKLLCKTLENLQTELLDEEKNQIYRSFCFKLNTEMSYLLKDANGKDFPNNPIEKDNFIICSKFRIPGIERFYNA